MAIDSANFIDRLFGRTKNITTSPKPSNQAAENKIQGIPFTDDESPSGLKIYSPLALGGINVGEEQRQNRRLKSFIFWAAIFFSYTLLAAFCIFLWSIAHLSRELAHAGKPINLDWHLLIFSSIMIVPATVIITILARSIFLSSNTDDEEKLPSISFIKDIVETVKAVKD